MGVENLLNYMFSSLFSKHKVAKGYIFMAAFQMEKSNPVKHPTQQEKEY